MLIIDAVIFFLAGVGSGWGCISNFLQQYLTGLLIINIFIKRLFVEHALWAIVIVRSKKKMEKMVKHLYGK
jgi:hypothetical protein